MYDLKKEYDKCVEILFGIGIKPGNINSVVANSRAKSRWGYCTIEPSGFKIEVNSILLDERNPLRALHDTLIHEILHTCPNCFDHQYNWNYLANKVNRVLGFNITRCSSVSDKRICEETLIEDKRAKYLVTCLKCHHHTYLYKKSGIVEKTYLYTCGKCGGKFKVEKLN